MALEIERKFLVNPEKWKPPGNGEQIVQAYLSAESGATVRVRIKGSRAFLTIKGRSETIAHPEFEYQIPLSDAREIMKLAIAKPVEKVRYEVDYQGFVWDVDVFQGKNAGLLMAEIELTAETQEFSRPEWLLEEVSGDKRYFNSYLSAHPFQEW
jgi:adenylate cyclase